MDDHNGEIVRNQHCQESAGGYNHWTGLDWTGLDWSDILNELLLTAAFGKVNFT